MIFVFWVLSQLFHCPLSHSSRGCLVPLYFLPLECCQSAYLRLFMFLLAFFFSPGILDSNLLFTQPGILHDILCMKVKYAGWQYTALTYSFSHLEPVCCSMSSSNCCFLTSIQVSQEIGKVVWYSHIFKNSPQFVVIHTLKGFGVVMKQNRWFSGISLLFLRSGGCWQFDLWFLCLF